MLSPLVMYLHLQTYTHLHGHTLTHKGDVHTLTHTLYMHAQTGFIPVCKMTWSCVMLARMMLIYP